MVDALVERDGEHFWVDLGHPVDDATSYAVRITATDSEGRTNFAYMHGALHQLAIPDCDDPDTDHPDCSEEDGTTSGDPPMADASSGDHGDSAQSSDDSPNGRHVGPAPKGLPGCAPLLALLARRRRVSRRRAAPSPDC